MPTQFSDCDECYYDNGIEKNKHIIPNYKLLCKLNNENKERLISLEETTNLPRELCIKILKLSSKFTNCSYCNTKLCLHHAECAKRWAKHYRNDDNKYMCNQCCWWEVS